MKKIFSLILIIISLKSFGQFPGSQSLGSPTTQVFSRGGLGADSGFIFRKNYPDTLAANAGFIKNIPNIVILVNDTLRKRNNAATKWDYLGATGSGGAVWGAITGTLNSQTDLQTALNGKQNTITTGTTAQYFRGDLSLATFPTNVSTFSNDAGYITSNIYNSNGTLTGNRTVTGSGNYLAFTGLRLQEAQGSSVASANSLTLGNDGNTFTITGNTQLRAITTTNWQAGSTVNLVFTGTPLVKHNTAGGAGTATILLAGGSDYSADAGDVLTLLYDGTNWHETTRKVAAVNGGRGSVTSVSVVTANGVSGSVATATTTPAITLTLGAITPTSVVASGNVTANSLIKSGGTSSQFLKADGSVDATAYLPSTDTTGKWVSNIKRSNDTVYILKNTTWTFAYIDSTGGGSFYDSTLMASVKRLKDTAAAIRSDFPTGGNNFANTNLTFTGNRSHDFNTNTMGLYNGSWRYFSGTEANYNTSSFDASVLLSVNSGSYQTTAKQNGTNYSLIDINRSFDSYVALTARKTANTSSINVNGDVIQLNTDVFSQGAGSLQILGLGYNGNTTDTKVLVQDTTTGKIYRQTITGGGGFFTPNQTATGATIHDGNVQNFAVLNLATAQFRAGIVDYSNINLDSNSAQISSVKNGGTDESYDVVTDAPNRRVIIRAYDTSPLSESNIEMKPDIFNFYQETGEYYFQNLNSSSDTTTYKPMGVNSSGKPVKMTSWPSGGGGGTTETASNLGGGLANYSTTVGNDLRFNSFDAADFDLASNLISIDPTKWLTTSAAGSAYQPLDADLTYLSGFTPTANVKTILNAADYAAIRTALGLVVGTNVQAYDADLDTWAGITPGSNVGTFLATPSSANLAAALTNETGSGAAVFGTNPVLIGPTIGVAGTAASSHITSVGTAPTVAQTGLGSGGSVGISMEAGSTDQAGTITLTTGNASVGSTGTITLTFNSAYVTNMPVIVLTLVTGATGWGALATARVTTQSLTAPIFTWNNSATGAAVALTANTTYKISYMVIQK